MFTCRLLHAQIPSSVQNKHSKGLAGVKTTALVMALSFLRAFSDRFEEQASISLLHLKAQLSECRVVYRAFTLQAGHQLLVLGVLFQEVPDGKNGPLADNYRSSVKAFNPCMNPSQQKGEC